MNIEHKVVPVIGTKVIDEAQGIVGAFVSVTGVVDSVKDRIIPGAYQSTLAQRTPKGVWSHDWDTPVSKTLKAEELLPGDDRLPAKTRHGEDWPTAAGALYVETQFNLKTQRGREAFEDVVFFGDEQEWSIGYNVPPGTAKFDAKTGVRELSYVDLYEYSPVLFGAMDLTTTAGVKDAQEAFRVAAAAGQVKVDQVTVEEREEKDGDPEANNGSPAADEVAEGFTDASQAQSITTPQDPQHILTEAPAAVPAGTGTSAGVDLEPRPAVEGQPGEAEVETPKTAEFVVALNDQGRAALNALADDFAKSAAVPGVDHATLLAEYTEKAAAVMDDTANMTISTVEAKAFVTLAGSYEERQEELREALPEFLGATFDDIDINARDEYGWNTTWVSVEATFNARVVAVVYDLASDEDPRYFDCTYTWTGDEATLKAAREVVIQGVVAPKAAARAAEVKAAYRQLRQAGAPDRVKTTAGVTSEAPQPDEEAPATGAGTKDAQAEDGMVTLTQADLLMLDRLKLDV